MASWTSFKWRGLRHGTREWFSRAFLLAARQMGKNRINMAGPLFEGDCICDPLANTGGEHDPGCPVYAPECSCYEMIGGCHDPGCAFYGTRGLADLDKLDAALTQGAAEWCVVCGRPVLVGETCDHGAAGAERTGGGR